MQDIKLLLVLKYGDYAAEKYDYCKECERCVDEWRKNAGWLKDIEIKIYSNIEITELPPGVEWKYFDFQQNIGARLGYDFDSVHLAGVQAHQDYPSTTFIHIDLDMCILRELPKELFEFDTVMGVYGALESPRQKKFGKWLAESDFIITSPKSTFYQDFFKCSKVVLRSAGICTCDYWAEEYICDYLLNNRGYHVFENYEYGQGFDTKPDNPYFWHCHILASSVYTGERSLLI